MPEYWDPARLLQITGYGKSSEIQCVGRAESRFNARCRWPAAVEDSNVATIHSILDVLKTRLPSEITEDELHRLAELCLCAQVHKWQVYEIAATWMQTVRKAAENCENVIVGTNESESHATFQQERQNCLALLGYPKGSGPTVELDLQLRKYLFSVDQSRGEMSSNIRNINNLVNSMLNPDSVKLQRSDSTSSEHHWDDEKLIDVLVNTEKDMGRARENFLVGRAKLSSLQAEKAELEAQMTKLRATLDASRKDRDRTRADLDTARKDSGISLAELEAARKSAENAQADLKAAKKVIARCQAELETVKKEAEVSSTELQAAEKGLARSQTELEAHKNDAEFSRVELETMKQGNGQALTDLENLKRELDLIQAKLETSKREAQGLKQELTASRAEEARIPALMERIQQLEARRPPCCICRMRNKLHNVKDKMSQKKIDRQKKKEQEKEKGKETHLDDEAAGSNFN